jgi:hypothetical protein
MQARVRSAELRAESGLVRRSPERSRRGEGGSGFARSAGASWRALPCAAPSRAMSAVAVDSTFCVLHSALVISREGGNPARRTLSRVGAAGYDKIAARLCLAACYNKLGSFFQIAFVSPNYFPQNILRQAHCTIFTPLCQVKNRRGPRPGRWG